MFGHSRSSGSAGQAGVPRAATWKSLGVDASSVGAWDALGFDAFAAALAQGDCFIPEEALRWRDRSIDVTAARSMWFERESAGESDPRKRNSNG
jgi:hypothetical protein